jgi:GNAT superfamily N-acetyltransferase
MIAERQQTGTRLIEITAVEGMLPADLHRLGPSATEEAIRTIDVVLEQWASGENRFDKPGEALLVARVDGELAGIGGITRDYNFADALRMRRFYVLPERRGLGLARMVAERLLLRARAHTSWVTLRAGSPQAGRFWEHLGFTPVPLTTHTHEMRL